MYRLVPFGRRPPDWRGRRVILTERSEVDGKSRRKPAVTIRAGVRGVGSNPLVLAVVQAVYAARCVLDGSVSAR